MEHVVAYTHMNAADRAALDRGEQQHQHCIVM
jgi:hypothetical protein